MAASLGALHALGPGHGKALVGAYLVGSRGTASQALLLGATVTATHTAGVYALGIVTLAAAPYVLPERLYPMLGVISGVLVVGIGASLAYRRALALIGRDPKRLTHAADHQHADDPGQPPDHAHQHDRDVGHQQEHPHPHAVPSLRSLFALGVSGGLLPCPTALVVLLAAISFHNAALGMALVAAFSAGLAAVLTGIGLLVVAGGRVIARSRANRVASWRLVRALPALSAMAIAVAGIVIALDAMRALA